MARGSLVGLVHNGIQILETPMAVQIAIVYNYLGFMILPLYVALDRIDVRMREARKDLGAGRLATFYRRSRCRLAGPGIVAGVLLDIHSYVWRLRDGHSSWVAQKET